ncbi:porin [Paraburkholderia ginsengiterrae]|uniref:Porin n=1 Tax=Paraburkholderia ginsengiterrae TaxID=1462993 RepID=A0A1A9N7B2_9BURK|nr:porin [Paraburkholderia ginsengiterrae]OAJ54984.1 porin [Paraburkholderia ginsengiterrae]OAJ61167.1 porin [Paraburkholderia ginsengiterrae]
MKKLVRKALASLALLGGFSAAAHAQNSITLYGIIDESIQYTKNATLTGENQVGLYSGNLSGSRWGLKGSEDLGGGLKAIFQLEDGFNVNNGKMGTYNGTSSLFGRQAYVGLQSERYGTVTLGRQYDPLVDMVQGLTDDASFGSTFATAGDVDNYDNSSRTNNAVKYVSPSYAGLQVETMYAFGGVAGQTGSGQTWSAAAAYNNGPLSIAAGYFVADNASTTAAVRTGWSSTSDGTFDGPVNSGYDTAKSINIARVAASYTTGPYTFGLSYSNAAYKADAQSAFLSTQTFNTGQGFFNYQANPALLLGLGYSYTHASGNTNASYNQVSLGADYSLSKRTDVYLVGAWQHASGSQLNADGTVSGAEASIGSYGVAGTSSQDIVSLGIRHKF